MKKSLVALAALAVVGAASAQSSVTLYGYGDMGIGKSVQSTVNALANPVIAEKNEFNPGTADVGGIRVGMKGSEDLGGGLKANFQLESNAYNETGAGDGGYGRATWFGISGGFGAVQLGRQARNSVVAGVLGSPAGWRGTDPDAAVGIRYSINNNIGVSSRQSSLVNYISPNFSGFSARVGYEAAADNGGNAVTDIGLFYANGPLALSYGYIKAENQATNQGLHGTYNFGVVKLFAGLHDRGEIAASTGTWVISTKNGAVITTLTPGTDTALQPEAKGWNLGATVPLGATTIYVDYAKNTTDGALVPSAIELGADYALSKRTALTAFLAKSENRDAGYYLGLRHSF